MNNSNGLGNFLTNICGSIIRVVGWTVIKLDSDILMPVRLKCIKLSDLLNIGMLVYLCIEQINMICLAI